MSFKFAIRPAAPMDAEALVAASIIPREYFAQGVPELAQLLTAPIDATYWIAYRGTEVLGFACARALGAGSDRLLALEALAVVDSQVLPAFVERMIGDLPAYLYTHQPELAQPLSELGFAPLGREARAAGTEGFVR